MIPWPLVLWFAATLGVGVFLGVVLLMCWDVRKQNKDELVRKNDANIKYLAHREARAVFSEHIAPRDARISALERPGDRQPGPRVQP